MKRVRRNLWSRLRTQASEYRLARHIGKEEAQLGARPPENRKNRQKYVVSTIEKVGFSCYTEEESWTIGAPLAISPGAEWEYLSVSGAPSLFPCGIEQPPDTLNPRVSVVFLPPGGKMSPNWVALKGLQSGPQRWEQEVAAHHLMHPTCSSPWQTSASNSFATIRRAGGASQSKKLMLCCPFQTGLGDPGKPLRLLRHLLQTLLNQGPCVLAGVEG
jgi:hypothetical protein